jgi:signal transduction histidine kinase
LQSIREQERDIIAKEIDYELGQPLAALQMDLYLLKNKMLKSKNKEEMLQKLESMTQLVKMTLGKLKNMITELWPPILDNLGIVATLEYHLGKFKQRTGIKTELYIEPEDLELNKEYSVAFFRIFQELLKNVEEHSEADQVNVFLTQTSGAVELRIEDTGKGITQEEVSSEKSLGLLAIKERIKFWNGKFEINGIPGEGTVVINKIPLNHEVDKND